MSEEVELHVKKRFKILKKLGKGAYGVVYKAKNRKTNKLVALKKIFDAFQNSTDAQRTYREVKYLELLNNHENIIKLQEVIHSKNKKDLYLIFDLMETDLHMVIQAGILQPIHKKFIMYQLFKSLKYIHSADLVHRDLKPSNMLLNSDCVMKLADFGLARSVKVLNNGRIPIVSEYIATRWYRAPEILLGSKKYSKAVDIWSAGCILAEILLGEVLFAGKSSLNQMDLIVQLLGRPSMEDFRKMKVMFGNNIVENINSKKSLSITQLFQGKDPLAQDLFRKLMRYDPEARPRVEQILEHQYFKEFHKLKEEVTFDKKIILDIDDNDKLNSKKYREAIYHDIKDKIMKQNQLIFPNLKMKKRSFLSKKHSLKNKSTNKKRIVKKRNGSSGNVLQKKSSFIARMKKKKNSQSLIMNKIQKQGMSSKLFQRQMFKRKEGF